jgi:hypothetical protein
MFIQTTTISSTFTIALRSLKILALKNGNRMHPLVNVETLNTINKS